MEEFDIKSISNFLEKVKFLRKKWMKTTLWFRGVEDISYELLPSLYRLKLSIDINEEFEIFTEFARKAKAFIIDYHKFRRFDWYMLMQHYGFPTRLNDWTLGSIIALFFATRNENITIHPCVYVIDPFELNLFFHKTRNKIYCYDEFNKEDFKKIEEYIGNNSIPKYPIAIEPAYIDKRFFSQKSCFIIHGLEKFPLEKLYEDCNLNIARLIIENEDDIIKIKKELEDMGITESVLFPDLEGLARELKFINLFLKKI